MNPFKNFWFWLTQLIFQARGGSEFLCDSCKFDAPGTCNHRERPNATKCADYRRRGR